MAAIVRAPLTNHSRARRAHEARIAAPAAKPPAPVLGNGHALPEPAMADVARARSEIPLEGDFKDF